MSSIDELFQRLRADGKKAFMPFVTAGDPHLEFTSAIIKELDTRGCHLCEVGIPYSDPIADGPTIQASYTRALNNGARLPNIMQTIGAVAPQVAAPLVTMVSYAIVMRVGPEQYVDQAIASGVAGAIIPDLPVEEAAGMATICQQRDFSLIQLVTPTTDDDRAIRIAETTTGFLYYVSVTGITGERQELPPELIDRVGWLRDKVDTPICIGFGIKRPEHVKMLAPVADGLIVGSAIVRRMADVNPEDAPSADKALSDIGEFVTEMLAAFES